MAIEQVAAWLDEHPDCRVLCHPSSRWALPSQLPGVILAASLVELESLPSQLQADELWLLDAPASALSLRQKLLCRWRLTPTPWQFSSIAPSPDPVRRLASLSQCGLSQCPELVLCLDGGLTAPQQELLTEVAQVVAARRQRQVCLLSNRPLALPRLDGVCVVSVPTPEQQSDLVSAAALVVTSGWHETLLAQCLGRPSLVVTESDSWMQGQTRQLGLQLHAFERYGLTAAILAALEGETLPRASLALQDEDWLERLHPWASAEVG
ncbi:hypothetical protein SAMN02745129_0067 [Ferrimonas marina]|uniref:Uncharacterized protein n=1 Tax=Ferrimonas marina TaxID=299255 RepID=A0A1M5Z9V7_9GAMM|nr:hypothetical protein SAMN02745129_0067 [Ferrimonas marina]